MVNTYGWVGSAINAWEDKELEVIQLAAIGRDILRKTAMIADGRIENYGPLDVMHDDTLRIGVTTYRALQEGTRSEIDAGYIHPEYNDLAKAMLGKPFTMSHASIVVMQAFRTRVKLSDGMAAIILKTPLREFVEISTVAFTVAKPGAEANALTYFRIVELSNPEGQ